jgi:hypothetical protein
VGHLKVRDRDDPVALAGSFCRIYGLDDKACAILAAVRQKAMQFNHSYVCVCIIQQN